jgi:hypothetical protein
MVRPSLCSPALRVLALVVAVPLVGCVNDGVFYSSGELPGFAVPSAGNAECELEVDGAGFTTSSCESSVTDR